MNSHIKTRFAPSPTGNLHIGGLRTALYNYLTAKSMGGEFVLRIEDTDQARYQKGSEQEIFDALQWTGIKYDNEDNVIYQSSRTKIYAKYAQELLDKGLAYYCFCTSDRLDDMRKKQIKAKQAPKYDRHCLNLSAEEIKSKLNAGEKYVIRMKIPQGETRFTDIIRGEVKFNHSEIDDQILIKSDGFPTYHLANVVDDHEMKITHVIRAEEWLPSTPKHILLYKAFGWQIPKFAHIPLVLAPDKTKLSKRHGATSVMEFKKLGYLPQALINYLALLGWNPGDEREIFSLKELIKEFDLTKVHQAGAIFDIVKLDWMNGEYIRQLPIEKLTKLCLPYLQIDTKTLNHLNTKPSNYIQKVISLEQNRISKLSEIKELTKYFFNKPEYDKKLLMWKKSDLTDAKLMLEFINTELEKIKEKNWNLDNLQNTIIETIKAKEYKNGNVLWPMRVALSGAEKSPSPFEIAEVLGKEKTLERIQATISKI